MTLTRNAIEVFGVLRESDEHELDVTQIAVRSRLSWQQVKGGLRQLCNYGLVGRRRLSRELVLFSLEKARRDG